MPSRTATPAELLHAADFAARAHAGQARKGHSRLPYINHPLHVAKLIADIGGVDDADILVAAILHDTVEDCTTTDTELRAVFGERVADIVAEVTDDNSLPKAERKRLQEVHAPQLSRAAQIIKLADKTSNVGDIADDPPDGWDCDRLLEYIAWGRRVVAGCRGANPALEAAFDAAAERSERLVRQR